jgi:hypothetical protein
LSGSTRGTPKRYEEGGEEEGEGRRRGKEEREGGRRGKEEEGGEATLKIHWSKKEQTLKEELEDRRDHPAQREALRRGMRREREEEEGGGRGRREGGRRAIEGDGREDE